MILNGGLNVFYTKVFQDKYSMLPAEHMVLKCSRWVWAAEVVNYIFPAQIGSHYGNVFLTPKLSVSLLQRGSEGYLHCSCCVHFLKATAHDRSEKSLVLVRVMQDIISSLYRGRGGFPWQESRFYRTPLLLQKLLLVQFSCLEASPVPAGLSSS